MPIRIGQPLTPEEEAEHLQFLAILREVLARRAEILGLPDEEAPPWASQEATAPADEDHPSR